MAVEVYPSFVVTKVLKWATTLAEDQFSEIMGIDRELVKLKNELMMLKDVLEDAEQKQLSNPCVRKWLQDLWFFALDAEDFLDELATKAATNPVNMVRVKYTSSANPEVVSFRHKITHLMQMLDDIVTRKSALNLMKLEEYSGQQEIATTMLTMRLEDGDMQQQQLELIGRDTEKKYIINQLLGSNYVTDEDSESIVKIIPIVGMGGIGKTTLAHSIFNEHEISKHFDCRKWVFVGENFDTVEVIKKICSPHWEYYRPLVDNFLEKIVLTKKFLIVLDNVCDIDQKVEEWENLWSLLTRGKKGGCVIVTSRNHKILPIIGHDDYKQLERLEDYHCWSIFEKNAFADGNSNNYPDFKSIGWEIVREKVKGVPLIAKMVGKSLLGRNIKVWENFLQNEEWSLRKEGDDTITAALRFCYHHLPPHLKSCVNYCATYPKAWRFDKKKLILKWMALGFLEPAEVVNQRMEDTGETYFEDLLRRSFFEQDINGEYVMHDLVHDLALLVSSGECNSTFANQSIDSWPKTLLHVSLASTKDLEKLGMEKCEKIRTISCWDQHEAEFQIPGHVIAIYSKILYPWFPCCCCHLMFKRVRVLDLSRIKIGILPDSVGSLIHLRYLDVLFRLINLPESVTNLHNLQTLNVRLLNDYPMINFPKDISKLINLRHLNVGFDISKRICGLKALTSLQEFHLFVARISDLSELNQLRGRLSIWCLKNVNSREEAAEANLKNKVHLTWINLYWGPSYHYLARLGLEPPHEDLEDGNSDMEVIEPPREDSEDCNNLDMEVIEGLEPPCEDSEDCNNSDMEVIEGLEPPQNLVHLEIGDYKGTRCPSWLAMGNKQTLIQLDYLKFSGCCELESIQLPENVTELVLESCKNLKCFVDQILPNLKQLDISRCPLLQFHNASVGDATSTIMFPALEELQIDDSYLLKSIILRCRPTTLRTLTIRFCDVFNLEEMQWQDFTSFEELQIESCEDLTSIPDEILLLPNLRRLRINSCNELQSLPEKGLPKSLEYLEILDCKKLAEECEVGGSEWPKISHVPNISIRFE